MLYLLRRLRTSLSFQPFELDKLGSIKDIWQKLKNKFEGKCTNQYGFIVLITKPEIQGNDYSSLVSLPRIDSRGICVLQIQFSAISFKVQKNDLIWSKVSQINSQCITCMLSSVVIKIPRTRIDPQFQYDQHLNCYKMINKNYKIQVNDFIMSKCIDTRVDNGIQMIVIAEIPEILVGVTVAENKRLI